MQTISKELIKKGDQLQVIKTYNGQGAQWNGRIVKVFSISKTGSNLSVEFFNDRGERCTTNLYTPDNGGCADEFIFTDRESQIENAKEVVKNLTESLKVAKAELDHLVKYESEEEFVADKLQQIMKTKSKTKMVDLLKELKKSNML